MILESRAVLNHGETFIAKNVRHVEFEGGMIKFGVGDVFGGGDGEEESKNIRDGARRNGIHSLLKTQ